MAARLGRYWVGMSVALLESPKVFQLAFYWADRKVCDLADVTAVVKETNLVSTQVEHLVA